MEEVEMVVTTAASSSRMVVVRLLKVLYKVSVDCDSEQRRSWKLSLIVSSIRGLGHCCHVEVLLMSVISYRSVTGSEDVASHFLSIFPFFFPHTTKLSLTRLL